jgi:glutamine cyclotransferase
MMAKIFFSSLILFLSNLQVKCYLGLGDDPIKGQDYEVLKIIKRDSIYYTQGLFFSEDGNFLYESGGKYGSSILSKMEYPGLKTVKKQTLSYSYFAEGIARCNNLIYQLTWQERKILKYSYPEMELIGEITIPAAVHEGWGLSDYSEEGELIATDGSENIYILDCLNDLKVKKKIAIRKNGYSLNRINDLAYYDGFIYANIYLTSKIVKINPKTGEVLKEYEMQPLIDFEIKQNTLTDYNLRSGDCLNGIAFDPVNKNFLLTGKEWGFYYQVIFK